MHSRDKFRRVLRKFDEVGRSLTFTLLFATPRFSLPIHPILAFLWVNLRNWKWLEILRQIIQTVEARKMSHKKWRETHQQLTWWPDVALLDCCLVSPFPVRHAANAQSNESRCCSACGQLLHCSILLLMNEWMNGFYSLSLSASSYPLSPSDPL